MKRVNAPDNTWLKMARSTEATSKKEVEPAWLGLVPRCLGIGLLVPFPGSPHPCFGFVVLVSGEYKFWAVFGVNPVSPLVAPRRL